MLWLNEYKREKATVSTNDSILDTGRKVGEAARGLFGHYEDVPTDESIPVRVKRTSELLEQAPNVIAEASFSYEDNFCSVDVLKNDEDGVEIYEVKSSTEIKDIFLEDVSYQYHILSSLGLTVKRAAIVYLNNEYVRGKELDLNELFNIEDVRQIAIQNQSQIKSNIDMFTEFMQSYGADSEPDKDIGPYCFDPYMCEYWEYCTRDLPRPNVFDVRGMWTSKKFEKYYEDKVSFGDLRDEDLNPKYMEQIDFELNQREAKIEIPAIENVLDSLVYPLYFIDYETCQYAIPKYEGTKPYQQIPFQYSLHIIPKKGAPTEHREYLAEANDDDMIRNFAESMIGNLPENGSVIVYNKGFESSVNKKIGEMYPDLNGEIERINANIVDLMVPFSKRQYYTREMQGSYSIKKVLPALFPDDDELDYNNLPGVHKGDEASSAFLSLNDMTPEDQEKTRHALLEYCKLDTYAMVKIWEKFKEVTGR
jgi:hypothetical protein